MLDNHIEGEGTNKATLGVKLLSTTVQTWQVKCGCFYTLVNTLQMLFCFKRIVCQHGSSAIAHFVIASEIVTIHTFTTHKKTTMVEGIAKRNL